MYSESGIMVDRGDWPSLVFSNVDQLTRYLHSLPFNRLAREWLGIEQEDRVKHLNIDEIEKSSRYRNTLVIKYTIDACEECELDEEDDEELVVYAEVVTFNVHN